MSLWRLVAIASTALLIGCASAPPVAMKKDLAKDAAVSVLAGTWEGTLIATTTDEKGAPITFPVNLRITIESHEVSVFARDSTSQPWMEQGKGDRFVLDARGSNAVIYANRAGKIPTPQGSRWFETYLIAATLKSPDQILVHWMRMVTNVDTPIDDPDHAGTSAGDGVLERK